MSMVSYKIVKASNGDAWVKSTDGKVRPNDMWMHRREWHGAFPDWGQLARDSATKLKGAS